MSDLVVSMKVPVARDAITTLRSQVGIVDGMRDRLPTIVTQADDPFGTINLSTLVDEAIEETAGLATFIENLANLSEAADLGMISLEELSRLERLVIGSFAPLHESIGDGVGAGGTHAELMAAIRLGLVQPNDIDQASYDLADGFEQGVFDLTDSFVGGRVFPDGTLWDGGGTIDGIEHIGGGAVLGPDGRYYPIVIPVQTDADGNRHTAGFEEDGWTQIGHTNGTGQFVRGLPPGGRHVIGFGVGTGLDIPATTDGDTLPGIVYRDGLPPVLTEIPTTYDAVDYSGVADYVEGVTGSPTSGNVVDLAVQGAQGYTAFQNAGQNDDRAYEVSFEQNEAGEIRATVTTHSVGVDGRGNPHLRGDHVYLTEDNELAQVPANYRPPDNPVADQGGVLTSVPVGEVRSAADIDHRPERLGDGAIDVHTDHL